MRAGFADLKITFVVGFRGLPTRESSEEMVRLLREGNRVKRCSWSRLDVRIREQHLETQQVLHAVVVGQHTLTAEIRALVARLDALIDRRGDGGRTASTSRAHNRRQPALSRARDRPAAGARAGS